MKGKEVKPHIGIFGRRNYGKSTIINILTGQEIAIVSDTPGTTTDPVKKSFEIFGIGPVVLVDTAGIDDTGDLGIMRVAKTREVISMIDLAVVVLNANEFGEYELDLMSEFYDKGVPVVFVHNKSDLVPLDDLFKLQIETKYNTSIVEFSSIRPNNKEELISVIKKAIPETAYVQPSLLGDFINKDDVVLLIVPLDTEAPEGRLILPQVQVIRDTLDNNCVSIILKESEVESFLKNNKVNLKLVITDSSIFSKADALIPKDIPLTGFSVLLAKHKGDFKKYIEGTPKISELKDGDKILMLESCSHHVTCDDIGRFKLPMWISEFTRKKLEFDVIAGLSKLKRPISDYALVVQCGGCMVTRKQLINRLKPAIDTSIPVTNYGMAIAYIQGIYERALAPFTKDIDNNQKYL